MKCDKLKSGSPDLRLTDTFKITHNVKWIKIIYKWYESSHHQNIS